MFFRKKTTAAANLEELREKSKQLLEFSHKTDLIIETLKVQAEKPIDDTTAAALRTELEREVLALKMAGIVPAFEKVS